jgi:non-ribosomal peptide synthetase component E (peptide arylation enzyme)
MTDILKRISDYASANAARDPNGEALVLGARRWTHRDVAESVDTFAKALLGHGITKGDRIAVLQTGLVTVLCRSPISLRHLGLEFERADAAQI